VAASPNRLSNRAILGLGLALCVVLAVVLAWLLGVFG
jgi:hypothetical protein